VKTNKIEGWNAKRKARDKSNHRLVKNKHLIVPTMIAVMLLGALIAGTVTMTIAPQFIIFALPLGAAVAFAVGAHLAIRELTR
jgi:membrane protein YdbS with pleckstrin-like domain